jgi:hypothetical protein
LFHVELYQRVWGEQFLLTDEQKADIKAGSLVTWQGHPIKHNGADRFHVLLDVADMHKPLYENQWLIKYDGKTEILWDEQVKSRFLFSLPAAAKEEVPKPFQSEALTKWLKAKEAQNGAAKEPAVAESNIPAEDPTLEVLPEPPAVAEPIPAVSEAPAELPVHEPAQIQNEFAQTETETHNGAPVYDAQPEGMTASVIGQVETQTPVE